MLAAFEKLQESHMKAHTYSGEPIVVLESLGSEGAVLRPRHSRAKEMGHILEETGYSITL